MTTTGTHSIANEYGLVDIGMAILTCECGKTFSTLFTSEPIAAASRNIADHAEHAAFMSEMDANRAIDDLAHPDCTRCTDLKESAVIHARAMGSIGCTYTDTGHSCTARRADR
ncbi:hypothetical protein [Brevibacterium aurantiacum]|uniref:Uncharacterized protein n=1 Tax=Brevibacterium aurantiacum TaxID=273384 RepID=A0A2H1KN89_BREAU|nr:hypothetical protein [Brevibacterium aurantiacum]SMY01210.1 hypothetical protein BAURA63_03517 [Brevibacterium aurantiacum]